MAMRRLAKAYPAPQTTRAILRVCLTRSFAGARAQRSSPSRSDGNGGKRRIVVAVDLAGEAVITAVARINRGRLGIAVELRAVRHGHVLRGARIDLRIGNDAAGVVALQA